MKKPVIAATLVLAAAALYFSIERIPAGTVGVAGSGASTETFQEGLHFRNPFSPPVTIYPLQLPPASGVVETRLLDGTTVSIPFEARARLDPGKVTAFQRAAEPGGSEAFIRQAAEEALRKTAASGRATDLASGKVESASAQTAGATLAPSGVSEIQLKLGPFDGPTLMRLAQALAPGRMAGLLREAVSRAISSGENGWEVHTAMGLVLESERDPHGAEKQYLDALTASPTALPPMAQLVAIYAAVGELKKLDRILAAALEAQPNSVQHLNWMALSLMKQQSFEEAEKTIKRAIEIEPRDVRMLNNLGGVQLKQGHRSDAEAAFRRAVAAAPHDVQSLYNLGVTLCAGGSCQEGLKHLLEAERIEVPGAALLDAIAGAYRQVGRKAEAAQYEKRAEASRPPQ